MPLLEATPGVQEEIRRIRNEDSVRTKMFSTHIISLEEHGLWLKALMNNQRRKVWVVMLDGVAVGAVLLNNLDANHETSDWAFYLSGALQGSGLGGVVEYLLLDYFFKALRFAKLNCEVIENNRAVIRMHQKFGFQLEGIRRKNVIGEGGGRLDVHQLGILAPEWDEVAPQILPFVDRIYRSLKV